MALTLNAEQKSIYDIFSGKTQYYIPPYQRPYSWQIQHCRELFEDLKREFYNKEKEGYFLGNIVLAWSMEERNRFEVIDGQQRLTTLLLLLKVLLVFDSQNSDIKNAIWIIDSRTKEIKDTRLKFSDYLEEYYQYHKILEFNLNDDICSNKMEKNRVKDDYDFEKIIEEIEKYPIRKEKNLFIQNICYFYNEIKEMSLYEKIDKFVDFVLYDIYLLPIETGDSTSSKARSKALKVFETINNRGLNLSDADIFKARLYEEAVNKLEEDNFITLWNDFESKSNKTSYSIDDMFYIYMKIILYQQVIDNQRINMREFFMENKYSPFNRNIEYNKIIKNLIKIAESIKFFEEVRINPKKYGELTKWFQIIYEFETNKTYRFNSVPSLLLIAIKLYFSDLENHKQLILDLKRIVRYFISVDMDIEKLIIKIIHNKKITWNESFFIDIKAVILLNFYLNENQKAIYPYYFIKIVDDYTFSEDIYGNKIVLDFNISNNVSFREKIKLIENSKIEDNINLIQNYKNNRLLVFDKIRVIPLLQQQVNILKKRMREFLKNED